MSTAVGIIACLMIGALGSLVTMPAIDGWYAALRKPPFNPPNAIFGPVWTALYVLMGVSAARIWERRKLSAASKEAMALFAVQMGLNALWSPLFFGLKEPAAALVCILLLWAAIARMIVVFRAVDRTASVLLWPYGAWVSFAVVLNASIVWLNR